MLSLAMLTPINPTDVQGAVSLETLRFAVDAAAGRKAGTLLLKNAQVINVFTQTLEDVHVLLAGPLIAGVGLDYADAEADEVLDLKGMTLSPGLIDGHMHIESALVSPSAYASGVLPRGVTAVVCDPHEIGNVAGVDGINWLIEASEGLPMDVWVTVPSCVPATPLETSGAVLGLAEIDSLLDHKRVVGIAEIMSFPPVIAGDPENLAKPLLAEQYRKSPEGHAPGVTGKDLQAYLASGIASDHEATTLEEGSEKLRSGVFVMIREGSVTRNLDALMPLIQPQHSDRIGFVTDDRLPHDLIDEGGVDCMVRRCIQQGINPALAVKCASYSNAKHYRLARRGAIAAGYFADIIVLDDLENFQASSVIKDGVLVAQEGKLTQAIEPIVVKTQVSQKAVEETVRFNNLTIDKFKIKLSSDTPPEKVRCIKPIAGQVLTEEIHVVPTIQNGEVVADSSKDLAKLVCVERYGHNGNVGTGLVTDFGLQSGALASTVGHDHHNLLAVAMNDADLLVACERLKEINGGFVVVNDGKVLAELSLAIAGLITDEPLEDVRVQLDKLEVAAKSLGVTMPAPFMTLSFLGLEVIPELRLTDVGLVDVFKSEVVSFEV